MNLRFWGTRGSIATPGEHTIELGGNTTCAEVGLASGKSLLLDCGTGAIEYASAVMGRGKAAKADPPLAREFHILVTHFHWDHILGFPFFHPIHFPGTRVHIYSGFDVDKLEANIRVLFDGTYSPLEDLDNLAAEVSFHRIEPGGIEIAGAKVTCQRIDHPEAAYSFLIEADERRLCFATDHEARANGLNDDLLAFAQGSDLLIHDGQFTAEEYESRVGWGHSAIEAAMQNGADAGARRLVLTHHDPEHSDDFLCSYLGKLLRAEPRYRTEPRVELADEGYLIEL